MKKFFLLLSSFFLLTACSLTQQPQKVVNPDPNHTHADFAIWIDGKQLDFSDPKYMSAEPAAPETPQAVSPTTSLWNLPKAAAHDDETEDIENDTDISTDPASLGKYLHLHDGNGHVLHRHKEGLTFVDFLHTIKFDLTAECLTQDTGKKVCNTDSKKWQMFINGKEIPVTPDYDFADLDHILLTYGADAAEITKELAAMTDDACRYSKTCPERGPAPTENCISDPDVPCVAEPAK